MIIDSSALVSVLFEEDDADAFLAAMTASSSLSISAATYVEVSIVVDSRPDPALSNQLDPFLASFGISLVPVSVAQAGIARRAYQQFGKGSAHPARLNYGDCFAYALAIDGDEPLLFKGDDFGHTDVRVALAE